ncbi:MAG: hypothetical protein U0P30_07770 [Vicinamibacterales bacterium]
MAAGVNYPWRHYGGDLGPTVWGSDHGVRSATADIATDFAAMRAAGVSIVRWFLFTDARGGVVLDARGRPGGLHADAVADLDALFALALEAGLAVVPVLFDHTLAYRAHDAAGARLGGHGDWLADPDAQARVLDTVVAPLADRYGEGGVRRELRAAIHAWDLLNEPDWVVREFHPATEVEAAVPFDVLAGWVRDAAATLHARDAGLVTIGNARLRFARAWDQASLGLDFLQAHAYYDPVNDLDALLTSPAALGLSRPLVIGECSAAGDAVDPARGRPSLPLPALSAAFADRGYAGAWAWSWRGVDAHGALAAHEPADVRAAVDVW